jgi:hypothetical protein
MFKIIGLLAIAPLLLAYTCADPKYPIATWQTVQEARQQAGLRPLDWDNTLFLQLSERVAQLEGASDGMSVYPRGEDGVLCELRAGQYSWAPLNYIGQRWTALPSWPGLPSQGRGCTLGPQYHHAAIVAFGISGGYTYEVMWLTD